MAPGGVGAAPPGADAGAGAGPGAGAGAPDDVIDAEFSSDK
jgi:hypothetical protein